MTYRVALTGGRDSGIEPSMQGTQWWVEGGRQPVHTACSGLACDAATPRPTWNYSITPYTCGHWPATAALPARRGGAALLSTSSKEPRLRPRGRRVVRCRGCHNGNRDPVAEELVQAFGSRSRTRDGSAFARRENDATFPVAAAHLRPARRLVFDQTAPKSTDGRVSKLH